MTRAEARVLLQSAAYFILTIRQEDVDAVRGNVERAIGTMLRGSYEIDEYEVIPLEKTGLYKEAITMTREMAEKQQGGLYIRDLRRMEIVYVLGPRGGKKRYPCTLRIIKVKNPKPLERDKWPLRSFDPGDQN